jgi:ABC-type dipeptide/oligopeptide/nickel transport system permease subunit
MKSIPVAVSIAFLLALVITAVIAPMRYDVTATVGPKLAPPSAEHWFGTDNLGRDTFTRVAYGARISILLAVAVEATAIVFALIIGTLAGYGRRWLDATLMRFTDGMFAFPDILLAILIMGVFRGGDFGLQGKVPKILIDVFPVFAALAVVGWPALARIVRNQVLSLKEQDFVTASRALGAGHTHVIMKHILPHLWGLISAIAMVGMAMVILAEGALSFLGIGVPPPWPSWGLMIQEGREWMRSAPHMIIWPSLVLSLTILSLNFVGDALRDRFDPKLRATRRL